MSILISFFSIIWYYFSYNFLQNNLTISNSIFIIGASIGSFLFGSILDLYNNKKVRIFFYVINLLCTVLLYHMLIVWSKYLNYILFMFGLSFSIGTTDFIKYIYEKYPQKLSLLINLISGFITLIITILSIYISFFNNKYLVKYLILHGLIITINLISLIFFNNNDHNNEKKNSPNIEKYFSEIINVLKDKKLIFYYLFLIINIMSVVSGNVFFLYQKKILFLRLGLILSCLLYYFFLPKLNMDYTTIFMMLFFNFLIYFKLFSPASLLIGHILFGICISSVFLSFIYVLKYKKYLGVIFGFFHITILTVSILFKKFLISSSYGKFLTKDLHVVLLQVNKKIIIHFYGYHIPIILMTIFTLIYFFSTVNSEKEKKLK